MKNDNTRELVGLSLYAALIIVTVQFIRIPFGPQFVHLGNALVVIAILISVSYTHLDVYKRQL